MARPKGSKNRPKTPPADYLSQPDPAPPSVTVVIPTAGDPWLSQTCREVLTTAPGVEVLACPDGHDVPPPADLPPAVHWLYSQRERGGVGPTRHDGIMAASGQYIILLDAHMRMPPGWLEAMIAPMEGDPLTVTCAGSAVWHENKDGQWEASDSVPYTGGRIDYIGGNKWPFEPGWRATEAGAEMQCMLGGAYGIHRSRYVDLLCPWERGIGWGTSEQTFCLPHLLMGGRVVRADTIIGHLYKHKDQKQPYDTPEPLRIGVAYNRARLIRLLPLSEGEASGLEEAYLSAGNAFDRGREAKAWPMALRPEDDGIRDMLRNAPITWDSYCSCWWPNVARLTGRSGNPPPRAFAPTTVRRPLPRTTNGITMLQGQSAARQFLWQGKGGVL